LLGTPREKRGTASKKSATFLFGGTYGKKEGRTEAKRGKERLRGKKGDGTMAWWIFLEGFLTRAYEITKTGNRRRTFLKREGREPARGREGVEVIGGVDTLGSSK